MVRANSGSNEVQAYLNKGDSNSSSAHQHCTLADQEGHAIEAAVLEDLCAVLAVASKRATVGDLDQVRALSW